MELCSKAARVKDRFVKRQMKLEQPANRSTSKNIWRPPWDPIKPDPINNCVWVFWCNEEHEARSTRIWRERGPQFAANHEDHKSPPNDKRRSQGWPVEAIPRAWNVANLKLYFNWDILAKCFLFEQCDG